MAPATRAECSPVLPERLQSPAILVRHALHILLLPRTPLASRSPVIIPTRRHAPRMSGLLRLFNNSAATIALSPSLPLARSRASKKYLPYASDRQHISYGTTDHRLPPLPLPPPRKLKSGSDIQTHTTRSSHHGGPSHFYPEETTMAKLNKEQRAGVARCAQAVRHSPRRTRLLAPSLPLRTSDGPRRHRHQLARHSPPLHPRRLPPGLYGVRAPRRSRRLPRPRRTGPHPSPHRHVPP